MAWYFLRVSGCETATELKAFKRELVAVGRVRECGLGTEIDTTAGWFVVAAPLPTVKAVRDGLMAHGLSERVDLIEPLLKPADGRYIAKQLALF